MTKQKHTPVLLAEVLDCLQPKAGQSYLDLTTGYGGHAQVVLEKTKSPANAVLVDRDPQAVFYLSQNFKNSDIRLADFLSVLEELTESGRRFDMVLADLGVSSPHLDSPERGFSFKEGPLDMRMDQSQKLDAYEVLNSYSQKQLAAVLRDYGQEPKADQIARRIVQHRPLKTTAELAAIAKSAWPGQSKIHPATRTFQAIRIAVNDELNQLAKGLPLMLKVLKPGGRLAIISFHSLEDRQVKDFFRENSQGYDAQLKLLSKKPLLATKTNIVSNPRARSAKLRAAVKIKNQ